MLFRSYGLTETYGNCCVTPSTLPLEERLICQGPPLPGVTLRIVDAEGDAELPSGETGEVQVRGYITPGYAGQPEENAAAFTNHGFLRTGDMGWLDEKGRFHFSTRSKEMIRTGGINVSPLEVEEFLATHPGVAQTAVTGAPDLVRGEVVVAFVIPKPGTAATTDELRQYCRERMASYKAPALVVLCESLPKTDTGKLARRELREWASKAIDGVKAERP